LWPNKQYSPHEGFLVYHQFASAIHEGLYQDFVKDPSSIDPELRKFFEGFDFAIGSKATGNGAARAAPGKNGTAVSAGTDIDWAPRKSGPTA